MLHTEYSPKVNQMLDDAFFAWSDAHDIADLNNFESDEWNRRDSELGRQYDELKREAMAGNRIAANARITIKALPPTDKRPYSRRILDVDALDNEPHVFGWVR